MYKLSIIIPYYNTYEYTKELLEKLIPQLTDDVEVIVIDDGCDETRLNKIMYNDKYQEHWNSLSVWHRWENSGGASLPRNLGIDMSSGKYITFIDSDDMIADNYIVKIMKAIEKEPDIIFLSWQSRVQKIIMNIQPPKWNCAVWCRVYKKDIIGDVRFDENLKLAEDYKFNQQIKWKTKQCIKDIVYYYNNGRKGSLING